MHIRVEKNNIIKRKQYGKKFNPETNIKKIESKIRANLNKMNDDVYIEIFNDLKVNLFETDDYNIINFFINILYNKSIYDKKFQLKYLSMLYELSKNKNLYLNYVNIIQKKKSTIGILKTVMNSLVHIRTRLV